MNTHLTWKEIFTSARATPFSVPHKIALLKLLPTSPLHERSFLLAGQRTYRSWALPALTNHFFTFLHQTPFTSFFDVVTTVLLLSISIRHGLLSWLQRYRLHLKETAQPCLSTTSNQTPNFLSPLPYDCFQSTHRSSSLTESQKPYPSFNQSLRLFNWYISKPTPFHHSFNPCDCNLHLAAAPSWNLSLPPDVKHFQTAASSASRCPTRWRKGGSTKTKQLDRIA